jgi:aspartate racemase
VPPTDSTDSAPDDATATSDATDTHAPDDALRTVGVLGGMSAESTTHYYERLNAGVNDARGGHTAAPVVVNSVNFGDVEPMVREERWDDAGAYLGDHAARLDAAGVEFVVMATNTMHRVADDIAAALSVPFVHIVDPTADAIREHGIDTVGVLGTQATMAGDFYRDRFADHGIETVVPDADDREAVDRIVFEELVHGEVRDDSRARYRDAIDALRDRGAEGIVLGCTEIEMLIDDGDVPDLAVFDTTDLHVQRAVELCLRRRDLPD